MVRVVREAYGENEILETLEVDEEIAKIFDIESVLAGFRLGLPNPAAERAKPLNLRTYRSETAEFFAREILRMVCGVVTPPSLHAFKGNALQPLLGYDGWGLREPGSAKASLVLIQVKGSDDTACPPSVASELAEECVAVKLEIDKVARALSACVVRVRGTPLARELAKMLAQLGQGKLPAIVVFPVVVRGAVTPQLEDLSPILAKHASFPPLIAHGVTAGIGAPLLNFGELVMTRARGDG